MAERTKAKAQSGRHCTLEVDLEDELEVAAVLLVVGDGRVRAHDGRVVEFGAQVQTLAGLQAEHVLRARQSEPVAADIVRHHIHEKGSRVTI